MSTDPPDKTCTLKTAAERSTDPPGTTRTTPRFPLHTDPPDILSGKTTWSPGPQHILTHTHSDATRHAY